MNVRDQLIASGEARDAQVRAEILSLGTAAIPELLAVVNDEALHEANAPGAGHAPIFAAELLCALKSAEALPVLLRALAETGWDHTIHDRLIQFLPNYGAAIVEPALALIAADDVDPDLHDSVVAVLAKCGVRDRRIYDEVLLQMTYDPVMGGISLSDYGDPAGLAVLRATIEDYDLDPADRHDVSDLRALIDSYGVLNGGSVPEDLQELGKLAQRAFEEANAPKPAKVGRNDKCPCGSGFKFKQCCLGKTS